jgi:hypothetical protein
VCQTFTPKIYQSFTAKVYQASVLNFNASIHIMRDRLSCFGFSTACVYDLAGLDSYLTASEYDAAGRVVSQAFGNATDVLYTYYGWDVQGGRLAAMTAAGPGGGNPAGPGLRL